MNARQMTLPPCGAHRVGQAVRALGVIAAVVLRSWLSLGVGLDEEAAEVRNQLVDLVRLRFPPGDHAWIERIGRLQAAESQGRGEVGRQVHAQAVRAPERGERGDLRQVVRRQDEDVGVDVVDDGAVDADRGVGARVVDVAGTERARQLVPLPQRAAGVAALDRAIHVVPVIEHPELHLRALGDVEPIDGLPGLQQPQEVIRTVERADLAVGRDRGDLPVADPRRTNAIAFRTESGQFSLPAEAANRGRVRRRPDHERALGHTLLDDRYRGAEHGLPFPRSARPG